MLSSPAKHAQRGFAIKNHWEIQGGEGNALWGIYDPHSMNRYLTPFPQGSQGWTDEDKDLPYFNGPYFNGQTPNEDTFTEWTAETPQWSDGRRVFDHDFLLAKPAENPQTATNPNEHNVDKPWWSMDLGFRVWNQTSLSAAQCAEVIVETENTRVTSFQGLGSENDAACNDAKPPPPPK